MVSGELVLNHSRSRSPQRLVMSPNLDVNIEFRDEATSLRRSFKRLAMSSPVDISLVFKEESASLQSNGMSSNLSRPPQLAAGKSQAEVPQQSAEAPIWTQSQELAAWQEQREQTAKSLRSASALLEQVKGGKNQPQWQEKQVSQVAACVSVLLPVCVCARARACACACVHCPRGTVTRARSGYRIPREIQRQNHGAAMSFPGRIRPHVENLSWQALQRSHRWRLVPLWFVLRPPKPLARREARPVPVNKNEGRWQVPAAFPGLCRQQRWYKTGEKVGVCQV